MAVAASRITTNSNDSIYTAKDSLMHIIHDHFFLIVKNQIEVYQSTHDTHIGKILMSLGIYNEYFVSTKIYHGRINS